MATSRYIIQNEHKYKDNKFLLPLLIAFFFGLGVAFSAGGFNYGRVFAVALVGIACLLNVENAFCLIVFAFPFSSMLKLSIETISILPFLYLIIIVKIIAKRKLTISPVSLVCFFLFAILQALCIVLYEASYIGIISSLLNIAFVLFVTDYMTTQESATNSLLSKASLCFATSTSLMLLLSDVFPDLPRLAHPQKYAELVEANRYGATVLDPNELAQIILISIGLLIAVMPSLKTRLAKLFSCIIIVYMAVTGIRTNSKSYAITLILLFTFLIFVYIRIVGKTKGANTVLQRFLPITIIAIAGIAFLLAYFVFPVFDARSAENTDILTNRTNIWERYLSVLASRGDVMLWGCGAGNITGLLKLVGQNSSAVPHNAYLEYIIQFGAIGLLLLIASWNKTFSRIKEKFNSYYVLSLVAFLITAFGISVNANDCPYILLSLLSIPLINNNPEIIPTNKRGNLHVKEDLSQMETVSS